MTERLFYLCIFCTFCCSCNSKTQTNETFIEPEKPLDFYQKLSQAVIGIIDKTIVYTPDYQKIPYPNGDVDNQTGVCTDVVIRAYRKLGIDLQKEVHEDMEANFDLYPKIWGLKTTDTNIDHRRVPNLQVFFKRKGIELTISNDKDNYSAGDIVTWDLGGGLTHIGIVVNKKSSKGVPLIVHNIGRGQVLQNVLFGAKITGHYRYKK